MKMIDEVGLNENQEDTFHTLKIMLLCIWDIRNVADVIKPGMERSQVRSDRYFLCTKYIGHHGLCVCLYVLEGCSDHIAGPIVLIC